jgi:hypothetical protein
VRCSESRRSSEMGILGTASLSMQWQWDPGVLAVLEAWTYSM